MEVLINELSLDGQFKDENEFFDSFDTVLETIKFIDLLDFSLLKEYSFFQSKITTKLKLNDFLKLRIDRARKMKQFLLKLAYNPPYWNETQKHSSDDKYYFDKNNICNTSLAESCERDKITLSFNHKKFQKIELNIDKNNLPITLYNLIDKINKEDFLDYLLSKNKIELLKYCKFKFENSNLNFSKLEEKYGFNILSFSQQKEFLNTFHTFSKMNWSDIIKSGANKKGLKYKPYTGDWFKDTSYSKNNIFKFRTSQLYRCFGYRENDTFFVLRFEIDHKISDNG